MFLDRKSRVSWGILVTLGLLSLILTTGYFKPSEYYSPNDDYFMRRFFARDTTEGKRDKLSEEYKKYSEDFLLLPLWTVEKPNKLPKAKFTSGNLKITSIKKITDVEYKASVESDNGGLLEFHSYYFPGWQILVDNGKVSSKIIPPYGHVGIPVVQGKHEVKVTWTETNLRLFANVISFTSLILISLLLMNPLQVQSLVRSKQRNHRANS
jgi:hypothetical protein